MPHRNCAGHCRLVTGGYGENAEQPVRLLPGLDLLTGMSVGHRCPYGLVAGHAALQVGRQGFMEGVRGGVPGIAHFADEFIAADLHADARVMLFFLANR